MFLMHTTGEERREQLVVLDPVVERVDHPIEGIASTGPPRTTSEARPRARCVRLVTLTTQAIEALREHYARAEANRGAPIGTDEQIFTDDPTGRRPWNPNLATARWTRHRKLFDLDHVRVHNLRHFVATELSPPASTSEPSPTGSATHAPPPPSTSTGHGYQHEAVLGRPEAGLGGAITLRVP